MKKKDLARALYEICRDKGEVTFTLSNQERKFLKELIATRYPEVATPYHAARWIAIAVGLLVIAVILLAWLTGCTPLC
jgi:hypothetical protein